MNVNDFMKKTIWYWIGFFEWIPSDIPDGAWWALHEEGFIRSTDDCCDMLDIEKPDGDANDLMHAYLREKEKV